MIGKASGSRRKRFALQGEQVPFDPDAGGDDYADADAEEEPLRSFPRC